MTAPRYTPEQCAYILAHAWVHDSRPPWDVVRQALTYGLGEDIQKNPCEDLGSDVDR